MVRFLVLILAFCCSPCLADEVSVDSIADYLNNKSALKELDAKHKAKVDAEKQRLREARKRRTRTNEDRKKKRADVKRIQTGINNLKKVKVERPIPNLDISKTAIGSVGQLTSIKTIGSTNVINGTFKGVVGNRSKLGSTTTEHLSYLEVVKVIDDESFVGRHKGNVVLIVGIDAKELTDGATFNLIGEVFKRVAPKTIDGRKTATYESFDWEAAKKKATEKK